MAITRPREVEAVALSSRPESDRSPTGTLTGDVFLQLADDGAPREAQPGTVATAPATVAMRTPRLEGICGLFI
jgi:hypothetical protein